MTQQVAQQGQVTMANFLKNKAVSENLSEILSSKKESFCSNLIALTEADAQLKKCDPAELMKCAMNATSLNLPLNKNLGYAYVIPYKNKPSFQIGYKGLIQLAIRTGAYKYINAVEVRDGEIQRNKFTGVTKYLGECPDADLVGYIASLELNSGFSQSVYMTCEDIEKHAMKFSQAYQNDKRYNTSRSKWSDPEARDKMALKTVLKSLLGTYGILSIELESALDKDSDTVDADYEDISTGTRSDNVTTVITTQAESPEPNEENVQI